MEKLKKLQELCNTANKRYKAGLNDNDQARRLFNYSKKETSVCVIIGYDEYNAMKTEDVLKFYKENPNAKITQENQFSYIEINYNKVQILTSILKPV